MSDTPGLSDAGAHGLLMPWLPAKRYERPRTEGGVPFELVSEYEPAGDQPQAIAELLEGLEAGVQVLKVAACSLSRSMSRESGFGSLSISQSCSSAGTK